MFAAALALPPAAFADADTEKPQREPIYRPTRPVDLEDFLTRCKEDSLYCEDQFALYIQRYAAVKVPELAEKEEYKKMRANLRDPEAFDGICLPRERLFTDAMAIEMARGFRAWAEKHKETWRLRPPPGIKTAMQALYPCTQLN